MKSIHPVNGKYAFYDVVGKIFRTIRDWTRIGAAIYEKGRKENREKREKNVNWFDFIFFYFIRLCGVFDCHTDYKRNVAVSDHQPERKSGFAKGDNRGTVRAGGRLSKADCKGTDDNRAAGGVYSFL